MNYFILLYFHIQNNSTTPLRMAIYKGHTEIESLLKDCGEDLSIDTKVIYMHVCVCVYRSNFYVLLYMMSL